MQKPGNKRGEFYVCISYKGISMPGNNCKSQKVVAERMVYMVTEYDFYEELKDAVVKGLSGEIENLSVRIIERREFEKTDFKLCLAMLCGSVVELRVMADEWYDPAAQEFDFSGLILKIRDALDKIYDRYGITGLEPGKGLVT